MNWKGRRVLVTGADGFIGSHLTERLVREGARVRAFCLYNSQGSTGWLEDSPPEIRRKIDFRLGDIRDAQFVDVACQGVDLVLHLAALIAIPYSYAAPESYLETNVRGTLNVLEAVRRHKLARLVHTSTSEVYGTPRTLPIRETHALSAQSPYAASKIAADQLVLSFHRSFGVPATILRPFNTYGPRQSTRAVLPTILTQLLEGRGLVRLGRLDTRRDLTYVADTVEGFLRAGLSAGIEGEVLQLGTGKAQSIRQIFQAACAALGVRARVVREPRRMRPDPSEVLALRSDPTQARRRLGWRAQVGLEEGLRRTARWFRSHRDRYGSELFHV